MLKFKYYFFLGGFFIVFFTIFFRFIRPRATGPINLEYTDVKYYMYIFLILIFLLTLIVIIGVPYYLEKHARVNKTNTTILIKIRDFFHPPIAFFIKYYNEMLEAFYFPIFQKFVNKYSNAFFRFITYIYSFRKHLRLFLRFFYFLPPCIISFTYLVEVAYFRSFTYFPYAIFLMIFPLGIRVILYSIRHFLLGLKESSDNSLIEEKLEEGFIHAFSNHVPIEKQTKEYLISLVDIKYQTETLIKFFDDVRFFLLLSTEKKYFTIFSLLCWITSFSSMLYFMLNN